MKVKAGTALIGHAINRTTHRLAQIKKGVPGNFYMSQKEAIEHERQILATLHSVMLQQGAAK